MNIHFAVLSAIATLVSAQSSSIAGISDFFVSSSAGDLFHINGQTLQAEQVATLDGFFNASTDIEYMGNGQLFASTGRTVYRYNTNTGTQTIELDRDSFGGGLSIGVDGLSRTPDGKLHVRKSLIVPGEGIHYQGIAYDINDGSYESVGNYQLPSHYDYEMLDEFRFLSIIDSVGSLEVFNTETGESEPEFQVGSFDSFRPISIMSFDGGYMLMSPEGELHTLDLEAQTSTYYGQISGTGSAFLRGATIPTPSGLYFLGTSLLIATRRRRYR